jgi:hypothetical protein
MSDPLSHVASWLTPADDVVLAAPAADLVDASTATAKELAALEFEPAGREIFECFANPAWTYECRDHGITLRLASALLVQTKQELIAGTRSLIAEDGGMDAFEDGIALFDRTADRLEGFAELLRAVKLRQIVASSALELELCSNCGDSDVGPDSVSSEGFGKPDDGGAA